MFEDMTFENILNDMLERVPNDVDKREGSIIYDALAPCAYHLAQTYFQLSNYVDLFFAGTAVGEFLDRKAADYGLERKPATKAVRKIETTGPVDIGTRWGLEGTTYVITEKISDTEYKAECEQPGEIGNQYTGELENIDNVSGVTAILTDILVSGEEEETDENLRLRIFAFLQKPAISGSASHYRQWALEVPGVGDAKVFPLWNGPGTVKVLIVDSNKQIDETLEQPVYNHIENVRPIGAAVTVDSPTELNVSVTAKVSLSPGYTVQMVQNAFIQALDQYRKDITFKDNHISHAYVGKLLFDTPGVIDYIDLKLNGAMQNVAIGEEEVPAFSVSVEVM